MPPDLDDHPRITDEEMRRYVADLLHELLGLMDGRPRLRTLRYLLDMARREAVDVKAPGSTPSQ